MSRTNGRFERALTVAFAVGFIMNVAGMRPAAQTGGGGALRGEAACQTLTPVSIGGPAPKDPSVVVLRWLGHTNYEIAYRSTVVLADGYFDRGPGSHPIGVMPKDFKKADAILVGHAHFDHISDVPTVASRTGATVVGAAISINYVRGQGVADKQLRAVDGKGGENFEIRNILVQPVLDHHNVIATTVPEGYLQKQQEAIAKAGLDKPPTDEEKRQLDAIRARGSRDPKIADEGTIGYLLTLGGGFRVFIADSPGPITEYQRKAMQSISNVDVAMFSLVSMDAGIPPLVDLTKLFKPTVLFIGHHDGPGTMRWASTFPAAMAIRDAAPKTRVIEVPYRTPVCFNTTTKEMFISQ